MIRNKGFVIAEWEREKAELENVLAEIMGTKPRTITSYALIGMAVKFIYDANKDIFLELGHPWEEMVDVFLPGRFRDAVRLCHPEISRPDLLLKNYLLSLRQHAQQLTMSQVHIAFFTWMIFLKVCILHIDDFSKSLPHHF